MNKNNVYILIGNIAAGKSTWVKDIDSESSVISRDEARYFFGKGKYIFDPELEPCIHNLVLGMTEGQMVMGNEIVIDETNMTQRSREWVLDLAKKYGYSVIGIVFPDRGIESHVDARLSNNHGDTPREIWEEVYTRKQEAYEPPNVSEGFSVIIDYIGGKHV